jgi:cyclic-di-GMP-binding biofilm dispersal mediator protein
MSPITLEGANALVLGATGGLGRLLTIGLVEAGAQVTAVGRAEDRLADLGAAKPIVQDLRTPDAIDSVVASATETGPLDIVINAVGVVAFGNVADLSVDAMEELFLTNTFIPIMTAKAVLPHLREGGVIVQIPGVIAEQNLPGMSAYGASKAAVAAFDQGFGREARRAKVRVLDAYPPHTETGLAGRAIEGTAPNFPTGLTPEKVAGRILAAIAGGETELPSTAF